MQPEAPLPVPQTDHDASGNPKTVWRVNNHRGQPLLFELSERFRLLDQRGAGAFGVVCAAEDVTTGELFAIKKVTKNLVSSTDAKKVLREVMIMRHLADVPNIISLKGIFQSTPKTNGTVGNVYLCMDLMETDLNVILQKDRAAAESQSRQLQPDVIQYIAYQILLGLHAMHSAGIMHRDLKPHNVLVNQDCSVKICDFGMARDDDAEAEKSEYVVTRWYRSPELLMELNKYDKQVDMFSFGCLLGELFTLRPLFPGKSHADQLRLVCQVLGAPSQQDIELWGSASVKEVMRAHTGSRSDFSQLFKQAPQEAQDLLDRLLVYDARQRLTTEQALRHPYFADIFEEDEVVALAPFDNSYEKEGDLQQILALIGAEMKGLAGVAADEDPLVTVAPTADTVVDNDLFDENVVRSSVTEPTPGENWAPEEAV